MGALHHGWYGLVHRRGGDHSCGYRQGQFHWSFRLFHIRVAKIALAMFWHAIARRLLRLSETHVLVALLDDREQVRLQIQTSAAGGSNYNGMFDCFAKIIKQEGVGGLFKGLSPALLRQASYSSIRMVCTL